MNADPQPCLQRTGTGSESDIGVCLNKYLFRMACCYTMTAISVPLSLTLIWSKTKTRNRNYNSQQTDGCLRFLTCEDDRLSVP